MGKAEARELIQAEEGGRSAPGIFRRIVQALGVLITGLALLWALDVQIRLALPIYQEQLLAFCLGLAMALIFLWYPASKASRTRGGVPATDIALALLSACAATYLAVRYPEISRAPIVNQMESIWIGIVLLPLAIESMRRTNGLSLVLVLALLLVYALFGDQLSGELQARTISPPRLLAFMSTDSNTLLGMPLAIVTTIVVMFIFMGRLLQTSGASDWFTDMAIALMGRTRGGAAKIAITASAMFGSISGSAVSNVVATGVITIPLMRRTGYSRPAAGGIEAVASTGGQILPPVMGAAAFLMAEFMQISYREVAIAAAIPGLLYFIALFIQVDLEAGKAGIKPVPAELILPIGRVFKEGWFLLLPFVALIGALFFMLRRAETAAVMACASIILLSWIFPYRGRRLFPRDILKAAALTGRDSAGILAIAALAGIIIGLIDYTGLGFALGYVLTTFASKSLALLLVFTAVVCIVLGMGMPTTAIYFLLATLIVPTLIALGIEPMAAHMFVLYFGVMSMITPPVAMAAFAGANLAGAKAMHTALLACRLGWTAYVVPFLFIMAPSLLMIGAPLDIAIAVTTAIAGIYFVSAALVGYARGPMSPPLRAISIAAGLALIVPSDAFALAVEVQVAGFVLAGIVIAWHLRTSRRLRVMA